MIRGHVFKKSIVYLHLRTCFFFTLQGRTRYTYMCHMHHNHISYTSIHTPAIPVIWWAKNLEPEWGSVPAAKKLWWMGSASGNISSPTTICLQFFSKSLQTTKLGTTATSILHVVIFFGGWHDFFTTLCICQRFTLKPHPPQIFGASRTESTPASADFCALKMSMRSCDGMPRFVVFFCDRDITVFLLRHVNKHAASCGDILWPTHECSFWQRSCFGRLILPSGCQKHTKLKRKKTSWASLTQGWQQSRCSMPRVRPFGGRFWPSHSACCNANSNCHSTIPGSSKYVKFPFHQKHVQKGRNFAYLEDPGIYKDLLLLLLPAKVIYQRTGISKPWNWRLQALLACAWQWGIAQDIASIVFHVAWQIAVKQKILKSQWAINCQISKQVNSSDLFHIIPGIQGNMMDSHPSAPALHQPGHPVPPAKCYGRNHNQQNTPKTFYTLFRFPSQAPCNFQRHEKIWPKHSLQATLPLISILNIF